MSFKSSAVAILYGLFGSPVPPEYLAKLRLVNTQTTVKTVISELVPIRKHAQIVGSQTQKTKNVLSAVLKWGPKKGSAQNVMRINTAIKKELQTKI